MTSLTKSRPLFFPLVNQDWVAMSKSLPPSQLKVFYYIRSICGPYEKSIRLSVNKVASELGLNRSTVSRALKQLDLKGLINLDLIEVGACINVPAWTGTDVLCDRTIASCDQAIASCDRHAHEHIYDRAREDSKDFIDPPLTPQGENLEGGEKIGEKPPMEELLASLQDQINILRENMNTQIGHFSGAAAGHIGNVTADGHHGQIATGFIQAAEGKVGHQGDVSANGHQGSINPVPNAVKSHLETNGHQGNVSASGHQGSIAVATAICYQSNVGHQGNVTATGHKGNIFPPGLEHIPQAILEKILDLGIPLDNQVIALLREIDTSQVNGALNHIEDTFEAIKSTKAVFLYKAPKMPVERVYVPAEYVAPVVEVPLETPQAFLSFKQQINRLKVCKQAEKHKKLAKQIESY